MFPSHLFLALATFAHPRQAPQAPRYAGIFRPRCLAAAALGATALLASPIWATAPFEVHWAPIAGRSSQLEDADGIGRHAKFGDIVSITRDASGTLYLADAGHHTLRKVTPALEVITLAGGAGETGTANGLGLDARFNDPHGVAAAPDGTLYVADTGNHLIRKIMPDGVVTTFAGGAGEPGTANGIGSAARFQGPRGIAVAPSGVIYVADTGNHTIRAIAPDGFVTTVAGLAGAADFTDGSGAAARFREPWGLAVDPAGVVYIADTQNHSIRKMTAAGVVTTLAGVDFPNSPGWVDNTGRAARFSSPSGITVHADGTIYVSELQQTIRKITGQGVVTTLAGTASSSVYWADGVGAAADFYDPAGLMVAPDGMVYVADGIVLRRITPFGGVTTPAGGTQSIGAGNHLGTGPDARFNYPNGLAILPDRQAVVADQYNNLIRKVNRHGEVTAFVGNPVNGGSNDGTGEEARFRLPSGPCVAPDGTVYVADYENNLIRAITPQGVVSTLAGSIPGISDGIGTEARFRNPNQVATAPGGVLYVSDFGNHTIRRIGPGAVVTTFAGLPQSPGHGDGVGPNAQFNGPAGTVVDAAGALYVADRGNHTIRQISPNRSVMTFAGVPLDSGTRDGQGGAARFRSPQGPAMDGSGNLYIADYGNATIRFITPTGLVSTLGGKPGQAGARAGIGEAARFTGPSFVAVDGAGRIWVTDRDNHRIVIGTPLQPNVPDISVVQGASGQLVDGQQHAFPSQWLGQSVDHVFAIYNTGGGHLTGLTATLEGPHASDFTVLAPPAATVPARDGSTLMTIRFTPSALGQRQATLQLGNNDPDEGPFTILLQGSGTAIIGHPVSRVVTPPQSVTFQVTTTDQFASYQWQKDGVDIPSATSQDYTIDVVRPWHIGSYRVRLSHGQGSAFSNSATLEITHVPTSLWSGLVSYYPFDGAFTDLCRPQKEAQPVNTVSLTPRNVYIFGKGWATPPLDGEPPDQYGPGGFIRIPAPPLAKGQPFTVSMQVKEDGYTLWHGESLLSLGEGAGSIDLISHNWIGSFQGTTEHYGSHHATLLPWNSDFTSQGGAVALNSDWATWTLVAEDALVRLYRNGQLQGAAPWSKPSPGDLYIGRHWWENGARFSTRFIGIVDDVRVYNRALLPTDVAGLLSLSPIPPERNSFEAWAAGFGLIGEAAEAEADPDGDRYTNSEEFPFGTPPNTPTAGLMTAAFTDAGLTLSWLQREDALYRLTESADLRPPWSPSAYAPAPSANQSDVPDGYKRTEVVIPIPAAAPAPPPRYFRVEAIGSPLLAEGGRVTTEPASGETAAGQPVLFSVTASGHGLGYQWLKNGQPLAGATLSTLRFASAQAADTGHYSVVVTNAAGAVTSQSAYLLVRE
ncbi:MAG: SMP-30/gluconolactonase/LRE family protein [Verrucomicrobiales bacterium]